jgi:hypothetical protein
VPPSPAKLQHQVVTIDEFCTHYSILPVDCEHLDKLEYCQDDAINKLATVDWQEQAGFSKLNWN